MAGFSLLLFLALCAQLLLLTISFSGQTSPRAVLDCVPDVCSTHAGAISLTLCGVSAALCFSTRIATINTRTNVCGLLVLSCLCLHAFVGHASSKGDVSLAELLQMIHLIGMATWSGGVIVSGLFTVPRLRRKPSEGGSAAPGRIGPERRLATYLGRLSVLSTRAFGAVIFSGLMKAFFATGGSQQILRSSQWGRILMLKSAFVALTVLLGARNRRLLRSALGWDASSTRIAARTLRLEGISMLAVLLLSAWLANSQPPLE